MQDILNEPEKPMSNRTESNHPGSEKTEEEKSGSKKHLQTTIRDKDKFLVGKDPKIIYKNTNYDEVDFYSKVWESKKSKYAAFRGFQPFVPKYYGYEDCEDESQLNYSV